MISLMFAMLASPMPALEGQAIQATLQSCAVENNRYVCRYAVPDVVIVPVQGTNIVADAPAVVLNSGSMPVAPSPEALATAPESTVTEHPAPPATSSATTAPAVTPPVSPPTTAATTTVVDAGPLRPIDTGVLTEREAQLVARCADAGWMSLCLPDDRRAARTLRDKQTAYLAVRRDVTRLLGEDDCDAAVRTALDGGYLALARETRDYCAGPTSANSAAVSPTGAAATAAETASAKAEAEDVSED